MRKIGGVTKQVVFSANRRRLSVELCPDWELVLGFHTWTGALSLIFVHNDRDEREMVEFAICHADERPEIEEGERRQLITAFPLRRGQDAACVWLVRPKIERGKKKVGKKKCKKQSSSQQLPLPELSPPGSSSTSE